MTVHYWGYTNMGRDPIIITDDIPGSPNDVIDILQDLGFNPIVLRPSQFINDQVALSIHIDHAGQESRIKTPQVDAVFHEGQRVWLRRPMSPLPTATHNSPAIKKFIQRQFESTLMSIYSLPLTWMNDYWSAKKIDQNKPFQQLLAKRSGLTTVPTLCTNNPELFRRFVVTCRDLVAVKACADWSAEVEGEGISVATYTNAISKEKALELAESVKKAPLLVQPYVDKKYELRVTMVGDQVFPCRIDSQASSIASVDWRRYDLKNVPHSECSLPADLERRLGQFMKSADLVFGAIDLIVTPNDEFVFLEVNPSGQYGWIESLTRMAISRAIANWLVTDRFGC